MAAQWALNLFSRLTGQYGLATPTISSTNATSYLNDAAAELTSYNTNLFATPVYSLDTTPREYQREIIYKAALNWWWDYTAKLSDHHSMSIGGAAQNVSEKWQRAIQMIGTLETEYSKMSRLETDFTIGNVSRFSKQTLRRIGGIEEENTNP